MKQCLTLTSLVAAGILIGLSPDTVQAAKKAPVLTHLGTYSSGIFNAGGAEIVAHDPGSQRVYVVNAAAVSVDVLSIADPANPVKVGSIVFTNLGASANSVAVHNGIVAVAVESFVKTDPGSVVFFDSSLTTLSVVRVGAQPDMVTFAPNGRFVLVANEGEPIMYTNNPALDPEGSVSVISLAGGAANVTQEDVRTADFRRFNDPAQVPAGVRIFGPNATAAQDIEPEYITISADSRTAWVTLQENNAIGVVNIATATVTDLLPLGYKDHSLAGNGLDTSARDNATSNGVAVNIRTWAGLKGIYNPDTIASYSAGGKTYLVMANEGEARADWPGFNEEVRVRQVPLGASFDPGITNLAAMGDLRISVSLGKVGDVYEELYAFGARSFSIRSTSGDLVYDSGDDLERYTALMFPTNFNANHSANAMDGRSPNKGPEPEALAIGKVDGRTYAFVGLERIGGIAIYDISSPSKPAFVLYANRRDFSRLPNSGLAGDLGPECIAFIAPEHSPNGKPLLVVGNEVSGTTSIFQFATPE